jgi:hypothetical protein
MFHSPRPNRPHDQGKHMPLFRLDFARHPGMRIRAALIALLAFCAWHPAAAQTPTVLIGSAPAAMVFHNQLFVAFQANDLGHALFAASSPDGVTFPPATPSPGVVIGGTPAMAMFRDKLFVAFQANDATHQLYVTSSSDGLTFPTATLSPGVVIGSAPAMAVFRDKLFVAFQANDAQHHLYVTSSPDGVNFPPATCRPASSSAARRPWRCFITSCSSPSRPMMRRTTST